MNKDEYIDTSYFSIIEIKEVGEARIVKMFKSVEDYSAVSDQVVNDNEQLISVVKDLLAEVKGQHKRISEIEEMIRPKSSVGSIV